MRDELKQIVGASIEDRLAFLKPIVEGLKVLNRRPVEARRGRLGAEGAQPEVPRIFIKLQIAACGLQVGIDLRSPAYAAERVDKLNRRAAYRLVHAALERSLVIEEGCVVPVDAEQAELIEDHRRDPRILVHVEVDEIRGRIDDGGASAGLCGALTSACPPSFRGADYARPGYRRLAR